MPIGIVCVLIIAGVGIEIAGWIRSRLAYSSARNESVRVLSSATPAELSERDLFIPIADGSWIAIRYKDSHHVFGYASSVARCSDGTWLESENHFCGVFALARNFEQRIADMRGYASAAEIEAFRTEQLGNNDQLRTLVAIRESPTLEEGKRLLGELWFHPFDAR